MYELGVQLRVAGFTFDPLDPVKLARFAATCPAYGNWVAKFATERGPVPPNLFPKIIDIVYDPTAERGSIEVCASVRQAVSAEPKVVEPVVPERYVVE